MERRNGFRLETLISNLRIFEKAIILALIAMMGLVLLLATVELGWLIVYDIVTPPIALLDIDELLDIFGYFLLVLIGIELLDTIKAYFVEHLVHLEVVVEVALIAIARKVIILDVKELSSLTLVGIAAIVAALAATHFVVKRFRVRREI